MSENQRQAICYSNSQVQVGRPAPEKKRDPLQKGLIRVIRFQNSCYQFPYSHKNLIRISFSCSQLKSLSASSS